MNETGKKDGELFCSHRRRQRRLVVVKTLKLMLLNKKGVAMQVLIAAEHSPLDMTALGRETLEESGIKKYVDGRWEEWSQKLHVLNLSKKHTRDLYEI